MCREDTIDIRRSGSTYSRKHVGGMSVLGVRTLDILKGWKICISGKEESRYVADPLDQCSQGYLSPRVCVTMSRPSL